MNRRMFFLKDIEPILSGLDTIVGSPNGCFDHVAPTEKVSKHSLDWISISNRDPLQYIQKSPAIVLICPQKVANSLSPDLLLEKSIVLSPNPNLLFSRIANKLFVEQPKPGIHCSTTIHPEAKIGENVSIGAFCVIGKVEIGNGAVIAAHVYIEDGVIIGDGVFIKAGAKLGQAGFGFVANEAGEFEKFPQLGKLVIGANVEIGSNTTIDKGSLSDTIIGDGTKISGQAVIAHNVRIGKKCFIGAGVFIAGSVVIEDNCWIAPSVSIREHVAIGESSTIGIGSIVLKDVPSGQIWVGVPAKFHGERKL